MRRSNVCRPAQFTIRGLLVATALIGVLVSIVSNRVLSQRRAVALVQSAHGRVFYDFHETESNHFDLSRVSHVPLATHDIVGVDCFHSVVGVDLDSPMVSDATLHVVREFHELRYLHICDATVTGEALSGLSHLPKLRYLAISCNRMDDSVLARIAEIPKLEELVIEDSPVTDDGIRHLECARGLRRLVLDRTKVTEVGIATVARALPGCRIVCDADGEYVRNSKQSDQ